MKSVRSAIIRHTPYYIKYKLDEFIYKNKLRWKRNFHLNSKKYPVNISYISKFVPASDVCACQYD